MNSVYALAALVLLGYMSLWFAVAVLAKRNDVADIAWGLGFVVLSWISLWHGAYSQRLLLVVALVTLWGLRLAWHIALRTVGRPEDSRYAAWRRTWTHFYLRSYVQIFLLQGVFLYVILLPILFMATTNPVPLHWLDGVGAVVWIIGFGFETIGDRQLRLFLQNPANRGKIMDQGLWKYSRHPNYFGEVTQWWGIFLCTLALPYGLVTVVSPLLITFLILYVSGIPMLEQKYVGRPDFLAYKQRTSPFVPWFPKHVQ